MLIIELIWIIVEKNCLLNTTYRRDSEYDGYNIITNLKKILINARIHFIVGGSCVRGTLTIFRINRASMFDGAIALNRSSMGKSKSIRNLHRQWCDLLSEMMINISFKIIQRMREFSLSLSLYCSHYVFNKWSDSISIYMKFQFTGPIWELNWDDSGLCRR